MSERITLQDVARLSTGKSSQDFGELLNEAHQLATSIRMNQKERLATQKAVDKKVTEVLPIGRKPVTENLSVAQRANHSYTQKLFSKNYLFVALLIFLAFISGVYINSSGKLSPQVDESNSQVANNSNNSSNSSSKPNNVHQERLASKNQTLSRYNFPLDSCGDKGASGVDTWYPVYIRDSGNNFTRIRSEFCKDAILNKREQFNRTDIQVGSFTSLERAEKFAEIMRAEFEYSEIGKPTHR